MRIRKDQDNFNTEEIELVAKASEALGHPLRVRLFRFIYMKNMEGKKVCNGDLCENFDYAQSTLSQHASKLCSSGLVSLKKEGSYSYYYVNLGLLQKYLEAVKKLNQ